MLRCSQKREACKRLALSPDRVWQTVARKGRGRRPSLARAQPRSSKIKLKALIVLFQTRYKSFVGLVDRSGNCLVQLGLTSRERPKSAPYLRLKNSKRTSKCQRILFYGTGKTQKLNRIGAPEGTL